MSSIDIEPAADLTNDALFVLCPAAVDVLDYSLPDLDGLEVTRQIAELESPPRILILTMHANEEFVVCPDSGLWESVKVKTTD